MTPRELLLHAEAATWEARGREGMLIADPAGRVVDGDRAASLAGPLTLQQGWLRDEVDR
jgi:hypothetical protein